MSEMEAQSTESDFAATLNVCGACKESLQNKEPKLLPCLHTLCHSCFLINVSDREQMSANAAENNPTQVPTLSTVKCPVCKIEQPVARVLDNVLVSKSKENPEEQNQDTDAEKPCTACDEGIPATSFCQECSEWLCDQCVQAHKRVRITKDHTVQPKDAVSQEAAALASDGHSAPKPMTCPIHKQEALKLYCETCQKLTCRDCQLLEHKDHRYAFLQDYAQQYKQFLTSLISKVQEKKQYVENAKSLISERRSEIEDKKARIVRDIKLFALKVISEMNQRGKTLVSDLEALCSAKTQILRTKNEEIKSLSSRLDYALKFAEHCAENSSDTELLYTRKVLELEMRNILRSRCEVPNPHHVLDIKFSYNPTFVLHVGKQGSITVDGIPYPLNANMIQQAGNRPEMAQFNSEQKQQLLQRMRQLYQQQQTQHIPQQQQQQLPTTLQQRQSPTSQYPDPSNTKPFRPMHQQGGPLPHQSATVSSSNYHNARGGSSGTFYPPNATVSGTNVGFGNRGPSPPSSSSYQNQMQLGQANLGKINLFQLQQRLHRQHQPPYFRPNGPPPSMQNPIVIEPTDDELSPIRGTCGQAGGPPLPANPASHLQQHTFGALGPPFIKQSSNEDSSQAKHFSSTTTTSPDSARPSSIFNLDVDKGDKAVADFNFDTDPMTLLESIKADAAQLQADTRLDINNSNPQSPAAAAVSAVRRSNENERTGDSEDGGADDGLSPGRKKAERDAHMGELIKNLTQVIHDTSEQLKQPNPELLSKTHSSDDPSEDYCAVCHNGGDLLCCDTCPKVFHLQCHVPTLVDAPSGEWTCTFCVDDDELYMPTAQPSVDYTTGPSAGTKRKSPAGLTAREKRIAYRILLGLFSHGGSTPFHEPVSKTVPNYYRIIAIPMDFGTVKMKLSPNHFSHYETLEDFVKDLLLVFTNCAVYNHTDSEIGKAGVRLKAYVKTLINKFAPFLDVDTLTPEVTLATLPEGPEPKRRRRERREGSNTSSVSTLSNKSEAATKEKKEEVKVEKPPKKVPVVVDEDEEMLSEDILAVEDDADNDSDYVPSQEVRNNDDVDEDDRRLAEVLEEDEDDRPLQEMRNKESDKVTDPDAEGDKKAVNDKKDAADDDGDDKKNKDSDNDDDDSGDDAKKDNASSPVHFH